MRTVYLVGYPGCGKTTALNMAIERLGWVPLITEYAPFAHQRYDNGVIVMGKHRQGFGGTDSLAMNVSPIACRWIQTKPASLVVGEGDRLANARFLAAALSVGRFDLVLIDVPPPVARERARQRAYNLGLRPQNAAWWKGRVTKTDRLVGGMLHHRLDGTKSPEDVASQLAEVLVRPAPPLARRAEAPRTA